MLISFKDTKTEKVFCDREALRRKYGAKQAKVIARRLVELEAAENLEILRSLPQMRAHELSGDRAGQISLDIKHPYRLLIVPDHEETPLKKDGGLDWEEITKIRILGVEDTHG
jgi:proteic killer suppression protein